MEGISYSQFGIIMLLLVNTCLVAYSYGSLKNEVKNLGRRVSSLELCVHEENDKK